MLPAYILVKEHLSLSHYKLFKCKNWTEVVCCSWLNGALLTSWSEAVRVMTCRWSTLSEKDCLVCSFHLSLTSSNPLLLGISKNRHVSGFCTQNVELFLVVSSCLSCRGHWKALLWVLPHINFVKTKGRWRPSVLLVVWERGLHECQRQVRYLQISWGS